MKFHKIIAVCTVLALTALAAVGCGTTNPPVNTTGPSDTTLSTSAPATQPATEPETTAAPVTEPVTEPEETVISEELMETYANLAMEVPDSLGYAVADISGDGQPELIVKTGTCEADSKFHFYAWEQDIMIEIGDVSASHSALALDENNDLIVYGGQMGNEWAYAVSYVDGDFVVNELYNRPYPDDGPTEYDNPLDLTYMLG